MLRVAFLLIAMVAAALLSWQIIATDSGQVQIKWGMWEVETSALFALITLIVFMALVLPLLRLVMFLMDAPGRLGKASERARFRRGQEALALGLIAAESGEFDEARRQADKAEDLIDEPRLAALLQARAAEVAGDFAAAERAYSGMLQHEDTELLGRKGLMASALKRGDRLAALAHADAALRSSKTSAWPFQYAFDLKVQAADWEGAIDVLDIGEKRKLVEDKVAQAAAAPCCWPPPRKSSSASASLRKPRKWRRRPSACRPALRRQPRSLRVCSPTTAKPSAPPRSSKKRGKTAPPRHRLRLSRSRARRGP